ncbi:MAG: thioredoxin [Candidatus Eisenbacteria bacterium]|uniref:Thioredoxin n=1 Tax=Eiseniibacteriota bacterium TaxID=2212470 RepID=A0A956M5K8_UNCEI|nr:thioredoxin [Candidatus Eisenbacteria bacterium]
MSSIKEVNEGQFESTVVQSATPTVVDFWAPWCGPCRIIGPIVEELSEEFGSAVQFVKVNVDNNQSLAARFGIQGIPTLLFFKDGEVVDGQVGALPKPALSAKVSAAFSVSPIAKG